MLFATKIMNINIWNTQSKFFVVFCKWNSTFTVWKRFIHIERDRRIKRERQKGRNQERGRGWVRETLIGWVIGWFIYSWLLQELCTREEGGNGIEQNIFLTTPMCSFSINLILFSFINKWCKAACSRGDICLINFRKTPRTAKQTHSRCRQGRLIRWPGRGQGRGICW